MNTYGKKYGCHTPLFTQAMANKLTEAGIAFTDSSWHNDELDSFTIRYKNDLHLRVWVGDIDNEDYQKCAIDIVADDSSYDDRNVISHFESLSQTATVDEIKEMLSN